MLSPGGRSWACSVSGGGGSRLLLSVEGGGPVEVCGEGQPLAVTDDGLLYYLLADDAAYQFGLYAYRNGTSTLIADAVEADSAFSLTRDHRELIFASRGMSYWLRDGADLVLLAEAEQLTPLVPPGSYAKRANSFFRLFTCFAGSFAGTVLFSREGSLCYLEEGGTCRAMSGGDSGNYTLSADGNRLLYTVHGEGLYLLPDLRRGEPPQLLAELEGFCAYYASSDLSEVYYQNISSGDLTLYAPGPGGAGLPVAEDVSSFVVSLYSGALYYIAGDGLFWVPPGETAHQKVDVLGTPVSLGYSTGSRALCFTAGDGDEPHYYCEESPGVFVPLANTAEFE